MTEAATSMAPVPGLRSCVHCGLCHQACPTYVELGTEADSPRGRIALLRAMDEGTLARTDREARRHVDLCLGCRACETACPSGVPYGALLEVARGRIEDGRPWWQRTARRALAHVLTSRAGMLPLRALARLPGRQALARMTRSQWLAFAAALPDPSSSIDEVDSTAGASVGTAYLQTGCVTDALFGALNRKAGALLRLAGWDVVAPRGQGCCGALAAHMGAVDLAKAQHARLDASIRGVRADVIVTTAAGCGAHLAADGARDVLAVLAESRLPAPRPIDPVRVAVHDPCHLVHGQGVATEVRRVLEAIPGVTLVPLRESDLCCGSAGTYNLTQRAMARRLLERKLDHVRDSGADVVVAANPGCLLQMRAGAIRRAEEIGVLHPLDLLATAYGVA